MNQAAFTLLASTTEAHEPAFPTPPIGQYGMSFREYASIIALPAIIQAYPTMDYAEAADAAVNNADALIRRLSETEPR